MFNKPANPFTRPANAVNGSRDPAPTAASRTGLAASPAAANPSSQAIVSTPRTHTPPATNASAALKSADAGQAAGSDGAQGEQAEHSEFGSRLIVGPDVKLKGAEILDCDTLVVEGRVEATMDSRVIRIAERGSFSGKVGIDIAEVRGHFEGELTARKQLIIHATGKVTGKIRYGKMLIEEGGEISGEIKALADEDHEQGKSRSEPIPTLRAAIA